MAQSSALDFKEVTTRLLARENSVRDRAKPENFAANHVCEKLRGHLIQFIGLGGYRSILSRTLALAGTDVPLLRLLHVKADGFLEGLKEVSEAQNLDALAQGEIELVSHMLRLLTTLIGPAITTGLVREIWPNIDEQKKDESS